MSDEVLRIGQLAERVGISPDTIRYYERLGLLPKATRTAAGYRQYPPAAVERVRLVRNALRFGFSLKQIGAFLRVRQTGAAPCRSVRSAAERLVEEIDRQIEELVASRRSMRHTLREWDERLAGTPDGRPAHLLETLKDDSRAPHARLLNRRGATLRSRRPNSRPQE